MYSRTWTGDKGGLIKLNTSDMVYKELDIKYGVNSIFIITKTGDKLKEGKNYTLIIDQIPTPTFSSPINLGSITLSVGISQTGSTGWSSS